MLKIMAMCDAHIHFLTSFPGQVLMEYNNGSVMPSTGSAGRTIDPE